MIDTSSTDYWVKIKILKTLFTVNDDSSYLKTTKPDHYVITSNTLTSNINVTNPNDQVKDSIVEVTLEHKQTENSYCITKVKTHSFSALFELTNVVFNQGTNNFSLAFDLTSHTTNTSFITLDCGDEFGFIKGSETSESLTTQTLYKKTVDLSSSISFDSNTTLK